MTEIVKPTLPKRVGEAIKEVISKHKTGFIFDLDGIRAAHQQEGDCYQAIWSYTNQSRDNMTLYFHALVNGYEVEQTPEDKVKQYYDSEPTRGITEYEKGYNAGKVDAIATVLSYLNIKIDGVTDND